MRFYTEILFSVVLVLVAARVLRQFLETAVRLPTWDKRLAQIWVPGALLFVANAIFHFNTPLLDDAYWLFALGVLVLVLVRLRGYRPARTVLLAVAPLGLHAVGSFALAAAGIKLSAPYATFSDFINGFSSIWLITFLLIARNQKKTLEKEQLVREQEEKERQLIAAQNVELERQVAERTAALTQQTEELRQALAELKTTQAHLIQAEKMASLGELTAGIAHEIQNPLNFVNNFADVSMELVQELEEEQGKAAHDAQHEGDLLGNLKQNLHKINYHGQRAARIVRAMLEHSRASAGERAPTDLNALCDEYLRLAYHGLRAKDRSFNSQITSTFDPTVGQVEVVSQDLGRALLNLFNNAFYAVTERKKEAPAGYEPCVSVDTQRLGQQVEIRVRDNGTGIPRAVAEKIFQPFFTTKPSGEGTGLGLSLSYDIITQGHNGTLTVASEEGQGTTFTITLPAG